MTPAVQKQNRGVEVGSSQKSTGSRFDVLEDEMVVLGEGLVDSLTTKTGVEEVAMETSGSDRRRVGGSVGSTSGRNGTDEVLPVENVQGSVLHGRSGAGVAYGYELRGQGSYGRLVSECTSIASPRPVAVSDMVTSTGDWDWNRVRGILPEPVLDSMAASLPPVSQLGSDVPGWRWDKTGEFRTRCSKLLDAEYVERESVLDRGNRFIAECVLAFGTAQQHVQHAMRDVHEWEGPPRGWIKGNVDAAVSPLDGKAAIGGQQTLGGEVFAAPPSALVDLVDLEQRRWQERSLVTSSYCLRVDPGG
ncbi:hypothetical protein V6N11_031928 [Hibiscus sabdariffa]|uniref:Uncharacterized protein n=1 Tax=Hibiscus sabdariffa TaxID=183260 RepID=A0ABR2SZV7_9ROSI